MNTIYQTHIHFEGVYVKRKNIRELNLIISYNRFMIKSIIVLVFAKVSIQLIDRVN